MPLCLIVSLLYVVIRMLDGRSFALGKRYDVSFGANVDLANQLIYVLRDGFTLSVLSFHQCDYFMLVEVEVNLIVTALQFCHTMARAPVRGTFVDGICQPRPQIIKFNVLMTGNTSEKNMFSWWLCHKILGTVGSLHFGKHCRAKQYLRGHYWTS